jgi:hypothetical protein
VLEIDASPGDVDAGVAPQLRSFTATFEQSCECGTPMDIGCIHIVQ